MDADVVIAGAGIGGLVTALELHRVGIRATVVEQGQTSRGLGVGLNVLPHAVRVLDELDLLDRLDTAAVRTETLTLATRRGQTVLQRPCGIAAGFDLPQFSCCRGRLQQMLLDAVRERLGPDAVRLGHRVTAFTDDGDGVDVHVEGREHLRGGVPPTGRCSAPARR